MAGCENTRPWVPQGGEGDKHWSKRFSEVELGLTLHLATQDGTRQDHAVLVSEAKLARITLGEADLVG